jgi:peptidyl-prolyl cis-trans isomerase B (cyclophilin B)
MTDMRSSRRRPLAAFSLALVLTLPFAASAQMRAGACTALLKGTAPMKVKITTSKGAITLELDKAKAPMSVENFAKYVDSGHYNGTLFHRVIDGFMIQGGGFDKDMKQKPTNAPIKNEADNGLKNEKYTVAMARTPNPDSATSQFFINVKNNEFLNFTAKSPQGWGYAVFGKVVEGKDVVDMIAKVPTGTAGGMGDVPLEPVVIQKAECI